jgi:hypothetical protein
MGWATPHIAKLQAGETAQFRPCGNSMRPRVQSGQLCTVAPVDTTTLQVRDVVLCRVRGREYLHLIRAIQGKRYQIGNAHGKINGWIGPAAIFGKLICVEP